MTFKDRVANQARYDRRKATRNGRTSKQGIVSGNYRYSENNGGDPAKSRRNDQRQTEDNW